MQTRTTTNRVLTTKRIELATLGTSSTSRDESGEGRDSHADHLPRSGKRGFTFCGSYSAPACRDSPQAQPSLQDGATGPDLHANEEESDEDIDTSFFEVQALQSKTFASQQDREALMCENLAKSLRGRPTLPADPNDASRSWKDLKTGIALPLVSCSFAGCSWHGETDAALRAHLLSDHAAQFRPACGEDDALWFDMYLGAIASIERKQVPAVGLSKDRQMMNKLTRCYNDETICSLVCTVCGQIKTKTPGENSHIDWQGPAWFAELPKASKTLDANCGWDEWCKQYGNKAPLDAYGPGRYEGAPQKDWCLEMDLCPAAFDIR